MITKERKRIIVESSVKKALVKKEDKQTIVHCRYRSLFSTKLRIWQSTYLIDNAGRKYKLIKEFDIGLMPDWKLCKAIGGHCHFTLVFEGLNKEATTFFLDEIIPEPYGFYSGEIKRNNTDIYYTEIFTKR